MNSNHILFPAEWYPQSGVQLTWPHAGTDWSHMLKEVCDCFVHIAKEIAKREELLIAVPNPDEVRKQLGTCAYLDRIHFATCNTNDTWARDHGAITLISEKGPLLVDFKFNGWGLKFAADKDNLITRCLINQKALNGSYENRLNFVLEGGSVESDGEGTLLTTSNCLLSPNRNGEFDKNAIENYLCSTLHVKRILWLNHGSLAGDDTDSHIDTLARFCSPNTIAYVKCTDNNDEHYNELAAMEKELLEMRTLQGEPYKLIALPLPHAIMEFGERLPATYANFLIMNEAVLYPTYNQPDNDSMVDNILQGVFPDKEIVGIDCRALIKQHGSLHCVTMQYPKEVIHSNNIQE